MFGIGKDNRYGYLKNPGESYQLGGRSTRKGLLILGGAVLVTGLATYFITKGTKKQIEAKPGAELEVQEYLVNAPSVPLLYQGVGMPFGIEFYEIAPDTHIEIDPNGISRVITDEDGRPGGLFLVMGEIYFVEERELNYSLFNTRLANASTLLAIRPMREVGPGYTGCVLTGAHIGETVYITLKGQIGIVLYDRAGEEHYVPLEVIDQDPDIWFTYVKPAGGHY